MQIKPLVLSVAAIALINLIVPALMGLFGATVALVTGWGLMLGCSVALMYAINSK